MSASLQNFLIVRRSCCQNYLKRIRRASRLGDMHTYKLETPFAGAAERGVPAGSSLFVRPVHRRRTHRRDTNSGFGNRLFGLWLTKCQGVAQLLADGETTNNHQVFGSSFTLKDSL
jgi:hypothetical protein